jgi:citrate synthase
MSWIDRQESLRLLGVKAQTLYAYVSRGLVASRPSDADTRTSVYSAADIAALLRRRRSGRGRADIAASAIAWGDPVMPTAITTVRGGRLIYRGEDAVALSGRATLEDVACLLWDTDGVFRAPRPGPRPPGAGAKARGLSYLAGRAGVDPPEFGRARAVLAEEARELLAGLSAAMVGKPGGLCCHERLGHFWALKPGGVDLTRRALVLVADHELNPSTFAARVAASTGASLAASALAGYSTLTGPLHGEASVRAVAYLRRALAVGAQVALQELAVQGARIPATGHALYPDGDPRAASILAALRPKSPVRTAILAAEQASGEACNIDMALAAMTVELGLPDDAPFVIFASGRMAGWMAHAMEQIESGRPIRPRATYLGRAPSDPAEPNISAPVSAPGRGGRRASRSAAPGRAPGRT